MTLTFTISVDVPSSTREEAENYVPYLRHLFASRAGFVGKITSIIYEDWLTNKNNRDEQTELAAYDSGELEL